MLNLLKKTTPWMVASLLVATSVFGQDKSPGGNNQACQPKCEPKPCAKPCPQPMPPSQVCPGQDPCCPPWSTPVLNAAYNYPARTQVRCPWDMYFDASFIYWQAIQENMEVALSQTNTALEVAAFGNNSHYVNMDFDYAPGFQVELGGYFDHDNWDMSAEYTWFHKKNKKTATAAAGGFLVPLTAITEDFANTNVEFQSISSNWDLKMDIVETDLGRWYYVGTKLTFRPSFGVRAAWIRQDLRNQLDAVAGVGSATTNSQVVLTAKTRSWAVGTQVAMETNWLIGAGFRMYGNAEADLLFTKYTKANARVTDYNRFGTEVQSHGYRAVQSQIHAVKPHVDLELGFGWGTYLDCNNWYMDFAVGYGFQVYFDQNMFRGFTDDDHLNVPGTMPHGNLYLQGLTATFKLIF